MATGKTTSKTTKIKSPKSILVLHGPNLNLLGEREPEVYGEMTLDELNSLIKKECKRHSLKLHVHQSNHEGELIDLLHKYRKKVDAVVINPGAYTHYSYAIRDAVSSIALPTYEVHLSDIKKREPFRRISVVAPVCINQISGHGWKSYALAIEELMIGTKTKKAKQASSRKGAKNARK